MPQKKKSLGQRPKIATPQVSRLALYSSIIGTAALCVSLTALGIKVWEVRQRPDVRLTAFSPDKYLGRVAFEFKQGALSEPKELDLGLANHGLSRAEQVVLFLAFSPLLEVDDSKVGSGWKRQPPDDRYHLYVFEDRGLVLYQGNGKTLAPFFVRVPRTAGRRLVAMFNLVGNFPRTEGLLYWNAVAERWESEHYSTPGKAMDTWNAAVLGWNTGAGEP